ncbi:MFS transporter [Pseudoglutamicibacter albus]|uniref:MFS transporter n=1 Tax=Pseudoglutamicibacter albus TaxID=98671 RepID=UPI00360CCAFF
MTQAGVGEPSGVFQRYARVLRRPHVPTLLLVGVFGRLPHSAAAILLTLHVRNGLQMDFASAGLVTAMLTIGVAIGSPWRGRIVDIKGVRRAVLPSIVVEAGAFGAAPFVGFQVLLVLMFVAGLFSLPVFTVVRQSMGVVVRGPDRTTAFALDSMTTELVFVIAPGGISVLATAISTTASLLLVGALVVFAGVILVVTNPPTRSSQLPSAPREAVDDLAAPSHPKDASSVPAITGAIPVVPLPQPQPRKRRFMPWLSISAAAMMVMALGAGMALAGTEVALVGFNETLGGGGDTLWVMYGVWCFGSLVGGFVYGALSRKFDPFAIIIVLGLTLVPVAFSLTLALISIALFASGFFIAPLMTAASERLTEAVPERNRGQAMGLYGSAMTAGTAAGTPLVGVMLDVGGPTVAICALAGVAVATGVVAMVLRQIRRRRRRMASS